MHIKLEDCGDLLYMEVSRMAMLLHLLSAEDIGVCGVVCLEVFVFLPVEN